MMTVPCRIWPSQIHGLGVFSIYNIPKGTTVWAYCDTVDRRLSANDGIQMIGGNEDIRMFLDKHAYSPIGKNYIEVPGDAALFINHSDDPNLSCPDGGDMIAKQDIGAGEEITSDYREFDQDPNSGGHVTEANK